EIGDAESAKTWSGITCQVLKRFRRRHDVILLHNLSKRMKYLYTPYILECKIRRLQFQLDRHEWVARHYARQVQRAYKCYSPDIIFSLGAIPLAYLPAEYPTAVWTDAIMHDMVDFYWHHAAFHKRSVDAGTRLDELALRNNNASIFSSEWAAE